MVVAVYFYFWYIALLVFHRSFTFYHFPPLSTIFHLVLRRLCHGHMLVLYHSTPFYDLLPLFAFAI